MYESIYGLCAAKNRGNCEMNGSEPTPRVRFLTGLLDRMGIEYHLDVFQTAPRARAPRGRRPLNMLLGDQGDGPEGQDNNYFNIVIPGSSGRLVVAHHDISNPRSDNANDNSASCINAIALKALVPEIGVILFDGEELGGIGSRHAARQIRSGMHGSVEWVLNLELTGRGGDRFFIGNYPGPLSDRILDLFDCPIFETPFNDSVTLRSAGIDSTVINPLPPADGREMPEYFEPVVMGGVELDTSIIMNCHSMRDSLSTISTDDMRVFVERVLQKIVTS